MVRIEVTRSRIRLTSYPVCLASVPAFLLAVVLFKILFAGTATDHNDIAIFVAVCFLFLGILSVKISHFDAQAKVVTMDVYSILGRKSLELAMETITELNLAHGRGNGFATGGTLMLKTSGQNFKIVDSDICLGHAKRLEGIRAEITLWLNRVRDLPPGLYCP